jgi:hypothetical protein
MKGCVLSLLVLGALPVGPAAFAGSMDVAMQSELASVLPGSPSVMTPLTDAQLDQIAAGERRPQRPRARAQPRFFDFTDEPLIVTPMGPDQAARRAGIIARKLGMVRLF